MKNILIVTFSYVAALIGAGFASGQEIISFFAKYGKMSIIGILLSCIMFGLFAAVILDGCISRKIDSYSQYLSGIMSCRMQKISEVLTLIFSLSVFCAMAACGGELLYVLLGADRIWGVSAICVLSAIFFLLRPVKALNINGIIGIFLTIGIIAVCFYMLAYREHQTFINGAKIVSSGMSYAGYNLMSVGVILSPLSKMLKKRSDAWLCGFAAMLVMLVIMVLMWWILSIYYGKINLGELPMLTMALRQNRPVAMIYGVLLTGAVLTTSVSSGISSVEMLSSYIRRPFAVFITLFCAVSLSGAGFENIIDKVYRICGYAGIVIILYILCSFVKNLKKEENKRKML